MKVLLLKCCAIAVLLTACQNPETPEVEGQSAGEGNPSSQFSDYQYSMLGPGPVNYGAAEKRRQPMDSLAEENTTGKSFRSVHGDRPDYNGDQNRIASEVEQRSGVHPGSVIIMGHRAWVNVMFDDNVSEDEQNEQVEALEQRLIDVLPRYEYQVVINDRS
ncbi:hypothetical protein [Texcoconibacillus texcoconensis]|uniref:Sporulation protein n=1 Tax=Texcoconibacillus texcoconensis TaxID=1095777 RepID=A0A840QRW5_9BACI|nr:hypothetical protein [Texcoconibacillus texcoconensis]MBB5174095.1 hypothetical protein [Texcoconibacillus texcoconensis]